MSDVFLKKFRGDRIRFYGDPNKVSTGGRGTLRGGVSNSPPVLKCPSRMEHFPVKFSSLAVEDRLLGELSGSRRMQIDEDLMNRLPNPLEFFAGCNDRR